MIQLLLGLSTFLAASVSSADVWTHLEWGAGNYSRDGSVHAQNTIWSLERLIAEHGAQSHGIFIVNDIDEEAAKAVVAAIRNESKTKFPNVKIGIWVGSFFDLNEYPKTHSATFQNPHTLLIPLQSLANASKSGLLLTLPLHPDDAISMVTREDLIHEGAAPGWIYPESIFQVERKSYRYRISPNQRCIVDLKKLFSLVDRL